MPPISIDYLLSRSIPPFLSSMLLLLGNQNIPKFNYTKQKQNCCKESRLSTIHIGLYLHNLCSILNPVICISYPWKCSKSLPFWNIENRGILYCGTIKIHIYINPWQVLGDKFHPFGNKCISLFHAYEVQYAKNVTGFSSAWDLRNINLLFFEFFWLPKMTIISSKQPTEHYGDGANVC